eukprot:8620557-Pyramimonas_sp.AAC.1
MAGTEGTIDTYVKCVETPFTKDEDGDVTLDQDEYIKQLRPIQHPAHPGADADAQASKMVADVFVSLRGALACALITQVRLMVYVVSLQRVQEPTNIQVRRLSANSRKLQACPKKIVYQAMIPTGEADLHSDSGYRRLSGDADDDVESYGIRGANLLRRGNTPSGKPVVRLIDAYC